MTTLSSAASAEVTSPCDDGGTHTPRSRRRGRAPFVVAVVLGLALIAAPLVFDMFDRAPKGATMLADFRPFMTESRLAGFHADIAEIDAAVREISAQHVATTDGGYQNFAQQWPAIHTDMSQLLDKVSANLGNYGAVAALPSFRLFPWFFVAPGVLIVIAGGLGLRPANRRAARIAVAAIGIGLVLAPAVFHMFTRAPKGGSMMSAFKTIETTANVEKIQGYFSSMAVGQGAIRLDIVPALEREGRSAQQVATQLPAIARLDRDWVHILNDMTPMIGAMSDNVTSYQAIAALPPFPLFPWFFVIPGVLTVGLALTSAAGTSTRRSA